MMTEKKEFKKSIADLEKKLSDLDDLFSDMEAYQEYNSILKQTLGLIQNISEKQSLLEAKLHLQEYGNRPEYYIPPKKDNIYFKYCSMAETQVINAVKKAVDFCRRHYKKIILGSAVIVGVTGISYASCSLASRESSPQQNTQTIENTGQNNSSIEYTENKKKSETQERDQKANNSNNRKKRSESNRKTNNHTTASLNNHEAERLAKLKRQKEIQDRLRREKIRKDKANIYDIQRGFISALRNNNYSSIDVYLACVKKHGIDYNFSERIVDLVYKKGLKIGSVQVLDSFDPDGSHRYALKDDVYSAKVRVRFFGKGKNIEKDGWLFAACDKNNDCSLLTYQPDRASCPNYAKKY